MFHEEILEKEGDFFSVVLEKYIEWVFFEAVCQNGIVKHLSERYSAGGIEAYTAKCFEREFLFDPEDTHAVRDICSPGQNSWSTQDQVMSIEKLLVLSIKMFL